MELKCILKELGEQSRADIINKFRKLGLLDKVKNKSDFLAYWSSIVGPTFYKDSVLSISRQVEILDSLIDIMPKYIENKSIFLERCMSKKSKLPRKPAWTSLNYSDSDKGIRLQFGFRNRGCQYWHQSKNNIGCYNCGYFAGTKYEYYMNLPQEKIHINILEQLTWIENKYKQSNIYDGINVVGDGSFLNFWEIPHQTQIECFRRFSVWKNVTNVLIETRPEYFNEEWIKELIGILRSDQNLEIAIGVESSDNFIRNHCINKGFEDITEDSKESSVKSILKKINNFNGRIRLQAYLLIKPAFVSEKESLTDAIKSSYILYRMAKEINPDAPNQILSIKYEPVVISRGTLLEVLYNKFKNGKRSYVPLNYWTITELLANFLDDPIGKIIRFGAREDMDDYIAMPLITGKNDTVSPVDFRVYNAVQKFTSTNSKIAFLSEIESLVHDKTFIDWKKTIGIETAELEQLVRSNRIDISDYIEKNPQGLRPFYGELSKLIMFIQSSSTSILFFTNLVSNVKSSQQTCCREVEEFIKCNRFGIPSNWTLKVNDLRCVFDSAFKSVIFKVDIENIDGIEFDLWLSVPTVIVNKSIKRRENDKTEI